MKKHIIFKALSFNKVLGLDFGPLWENYLLHGVYLVARVTAPLLMLICHGYGKLMGFSNIAPHFPDPLGLGSTLSLILVIGAEFFGSLLLILGLFSRWSAFSLFFTMMVVVFIHHWADPFKEKELAVLYGLFFLFFTMAGGGKYSLDNWLKKKF